MRIAIIGSGISGMVAAYLLSRSHDTALYEEKARIGGHTNTVDVETATGSVPVDTGFIVFNEVTYPNFCEIIRRLGVFSQPTSMSFSMKCERTGLEYNPRSLNTFFGQRKNLFSPSFYRMISEIIGFRREFDRLCEGDDGDLELGQYLGERGYSRRFIDQFIIPLGSAIWSAEPEGFKRFPLRHFVTFFRNHGFLSVKNPITWRVITGGSKEYVKKLTASYADRVRLNSPVVKVTREQAHVTVEGRDGSRERFDHVVIATHSDQALRLLGDPTDAEREILGAIPYQENQAVLHTDASLLPERSSLWASWNYLTPKEESGRVAITYNLTIMQALEGDEVYCLTLNQPDKIDRERVIARITYHHPVYSAEGFAAQKRYAEVGGRNRTHYCGAYWGFGFHEDGVKSALRACAFFGEKL
ncbi:MAG: NAD(P)-binding protein [Deltaproteobacteria bacterium]|nr:NAD(P)-binding protein [Deltaproteobacteria bacterium]NIS76147.1 NAD(P)-binding protein [Deltaproteobacteria bacterium]